MFVIPMTRHSADLSRRIERLFQVDPTAVSLRSPAMDVTETETSYSVQLDLPGVSKDAVKIRIEGRRVSVDAEQAPAIDPAPEHQVLLRERAMTRYSRSFALPREVSQADSTAKLENGVLTLTLVKRQPDNGGQIAVS